jgi:DNA-binding CsgD family transcriptional regulator
VVPKPAALNTVRTQLKSVFQKLGVHSQLQLQRTLQALAAPAHDLH